MELHELSSTIMPPPDVTLTFDFLIPKTNRHTCKSKYSKLRQSWVKFPSLVCEIGYMVFRRFSGRTDSHTHGRTDPNTECISTVLTVAKASK